MKAEITVLSGDGIGPEITEHALHILTAIEKKYGHEFILHDALFGVLPSTKLAILIHRKQGIFAKHLMLFF